MKRWRIGCPSNPHGWAVDCMEYSVDFCFSFLILNCVFTLHLPTSQLLPEAIAKPHISIHLTPTLMYNTITMLYHILDPFYFAFSLYLLSGWISDFLERSRAATATRRLSASSISQYHLIILLLLCYHFIFSQPWNFRKCQVYGHENIALI